MENATYVRLGVHGNKHTVAADASRSRGYAPSSHNLWAPRGVRVGGSDPTRSFHRSAEPMPGRKEGPQGRPRGSGTRGGLAMKSKAACAVVGLLWPPAGCRPAR